MPEEHRAEKHDTPRHRDARHQHDARHDESGEADRDFARQIHRTTAMNQPARPTTAEQAAHTRRRERNPRDGADGFDVEAARVEQIFREPEDVEVPRRVAEKFYGDDGPGLAEP